MIELGLQRIAQLVPGKLPWKAIHVAGTNGKGSVCAYISSCLQAAGISHGRFTSPHLVNRWDCITLNGSTVDRNIFINAEEIVKERDSKLGIGASEFELLTATAFEIFSKQKVDVAVVEVGMGGRLDATNILEDPIVTVITKIGLDHQGFLGNTIQEIALEKAGILKKGSPCIVDGSNEESVLAAIRQKAIDTGAGPVHFAIPEAIKEDACEVRTSAFGLQKFTSFLKGNYQPHNLSCAVNALSCLSERFPSITSDTVQGGIKETKWPGRMETLDVKNITGNAKDLVLVDGAHNSQAAEALADYVNKILRPKRAGVHWILAFSRGKDIRQALQLLIKPEDTVFSVEFGPVDGMPWATSEDAGNVAKMVQEVSKDTKILEFGKDIAVAINEAVKSSECVNVVIAGSLYLVADVMRLVRR
ncbi:folylpolyglutamate synthase [Rhizina undulata]